MSSPLLEKVITQMGAALGPNAGLDGTFKFDFREFGSVFLDGKSIPNSVSDGAGKKADCTIKMDIATFEKLTTGELNAMGAYMQGKMEVTGDLHLAMRIGPVLQKVPR